METYIVIIYVDKDNKIKVGSLGDVGFSKGYYLYIGSGGVNTLKRISRHYRIGKRIRWHIDYLTNFYPAIESYIIKNKDIDECTLSLYMAENGFKYIKRFGSTDKKSPSHLFYFESRRELEKALKFLSHKMQLIKVDSVIDLI